MLLGKKRRIDFSIVTPAKNAEKTIGKCMENLLNQNYPKQKYEIIVVDNNSTDKTTDAIKQYPVKYLLEKKPGAAATRNLGIKNANGKIIAFIDSDRYADKNWLAKAKEEFDKKRINLLAGEVKPEKGASRVEKILVDWGMDQQCSVESGYAATCNLFAERRTFKKVGLFDEKDLWLDAEDVEFCLRAKDHGFKLEFSPEVIVYYKPRTLGGAIKREFRRGRAAAHVRRLAKNRAYLANITKKRKPFKHLKRVLRKKNRDFLDLPIVIFVYFAFLFSSLAGETYEKLHSRLK